MSVFFIYFVFSNKHYNFYNKYTWKNVHPVYAAGIQTTYFRTWVSSHNHSTRQPAQWWASVTLPVKILHFKIERYVRRSHADLSRLGQFIFRHLVVGGSTLRNVTSKLYVQFRFDSKQHSIQIFSDPISRLIRNSICYISSHYIPSGIYYGHLCPWPSPQPTACWSPTWSLITTTKST